MTIKRILFRSVVRSMEQMYLLQGANRCTKSGLSFERLPEGNKHTDIITVAFNNAQIIPFHIEYVKKYWLDDHTHIIADNSSDQNCANLIRDYCKENGVCYIRMPKNYLNIIGGSYSHATALNWIYKHIISKRCPAFFGFTDHDLFPIKPISLIQTIQSQHIYGPIRVRGGEGKYWYLSAILCFFDREYVRDKKMDFMPVNYGNDNSSYLDTGGGNWLRLYSKEDQSKIVFCKERMEKIGEGNDRHNDYVEIFDDVFLHTINGADLQYNDEQTHQSKNSQLQELIRRFECKD